MVAALQDLDEDRVAVAPLSGLVVGYVCLTPAGRYYVLNDQIAAEHHACAVEHIDRHAAGAAACDDVAAWCEAATCPWARLWFGVEATTCASGSA